MPLRKTCDTLTEFVQELQGFFQQVSACHLHLVVNRGLPWLSQEDLEPIYRRVRRNY